MNILRLIKPARDLQRLYQSRSVARLNIEPGKFGSLDVDHTNVDADDNELFASDQAFEQVRKRSYVQPESYEKAIKKKLNLGKNNQALATFNQMICVDGQCPTEYTYRVLISNLYDPVIAGGYLLNDLIKSASSDMSKLRLVFSPTLLYKSIHRCPSKMIATAYINDLNDFLRRQRQIGTLNTLNTFVYNAKLGSMAHLGCGPADCIDVVLNEMVADGCWPQVDTMNSVLIACSNEAKGSIEAFSRLALETGQFFFEQYRIVPNTHTFNIILRSLRPQPVWTINDPAPSDAIVASKNHSLFSHFQISQALSILCDNHIDPNAYLSLMNYSNAPPNLKTFHLLLQIIPVDDGFGEDNLEIIARNSNVHIDEAWYNTKIIRAIKRIGSVENERVKGILAQMTANGIELGFGTVKALANGCANIEEANELVEKMTEMGFMDCSVEQIPQVSAIFQVLAQKASQSLDQDYCTFVLRQAGDRFVNWWILHELRVFIQKMRNQIVEMENSQRYNTDLAEEGAKFHELWRLFRTSENTVRQRKLKFE
ncbi:hypothetical protein ACOME3_002962 [Neoechinorhynchus agilis]